MKESEENSHGHYRLKFDAEAVKFMNDYKVSFGSTIQWFVEDAVNKKIQELKLKIELGELPDVI